MRFIYLLLIFPLKGLVFPFYKNSCKYKIKLLQDDILKKKNEIKNIEVELNNKTLGELIKLNQKFIKNENKFIKLEKK